MRSAAEQKYVAIYIDKVKSGGTSAEIAERTGHPVRTVDRALAWVRDNGLVRDSIQEEFEKCRLRILEKLQQIEVDLEKCSKSKKYLGKKAALYRVQREYLELYMEMTGVHGRTVHIDVHGEVLHGVVLLPPKMSPEEWAKQYGSSRNPQKVEVKEITELPALPIPPGSK